MSIHKGHLSHIQGKQPRIVPPRGTHVLILYFPSSYKYHPHSFLSSHSTHPRHPRRKARLEEKREGVAVPSSLLEIVNSKVEFMPVRGLWSSPGKIPNALSAQRYRMESDDLVIIKYDHGGQGCASRDPFLL
ncbi:hypothetical protein Taro_031801 [Colocasia esculenta]|uniref:Uncharacterized protein n=1 Tax=Colocasia esculenta TaxID=4460 RepID=A0A843VXL1_COLES|nr:hypothetical protein [Colocasia esculenta]